MRSSSPTVARLTRLAVVVALLSGCALSAAALAHPASAMSAASQDVAELPSAEEIISRYVEVIGGEDAILAHRSKRVRATLVGPMATSEWTEYTAAPNKRLRRGELDGTVRQEEGFNGEVGWVAFGIDKGPHVMVGKQLVDVREQADFYVELHDPANYTSIDTVEVTEFDGKECYKLKLVTKSGNESFEYFDTKTGLIAGREAPLAGPRGTVTRRETWSEYREFGGVLSPTKLVWTYEGVPIKQTVTFHAIEYDGVSDEVFAVSEELWEDPWPWATRLADTLQLGPGMVAADVGAGDGAWAAAMAKSVDPHGYVFANEIAPNLLETIRETMEAFGVDNVTPVLGSEIDTGLPPACCDRILLRYVYHELSDSEAMNASTLRALRPGSLIAVIEDKEAPNHNIAPETLIEEMTRAGFEFVSQIDEWDGQPSRYCVLFRKPR